MQQSCLHHISHCRDNPDVDIYGANLFGRFLDKRKSKKRSVALKAHGSGHVTEDGVTSPTEQESEKEERTELDAVESVLVCTGVYSRNRDYSLQNKKLLLDHNHRDFIMDPELKKPQHTVTNVLEAVKLILQKEKYS